MTRKTAFIGLRAMGGPMASNTIRSPGSIHVVEIVGAQLAPVIASGGVDRATAPA